MYWHALEYCNRLCVYIECFTNTNECMQALLAAVVMTKRLTLNSTSRNPSCRSRSPRGRASQGGTCGTGFCKAETGSQGTDYRLERRPHATEHATEHGGTLWPWPQRQQLGLWTNDGCPEAMAVCRMPQTEAGAMTVPGLGLRG